MRYFPVFVIAGLMLVSSGYVSAGGEVSTVSLPPAIAHSDDYKTLVDGLKAGEASAQFKLGSMFAFGNGVTRNFTKALYWYRKAAEQGNAEGQNALGVMYKNGQGGPQNYSKAVHWYRKAADQGLAHAQYNLGVMYYQGQGVAKSYAQAVTWYRKAAKQGLARAQYLVGLMYEKGQGVPQSYARAAKWYRKAYEQHDLYAKYGIAVTHGLVVAPKRYAQARGQKTGSGTIMLTTTGLLNVVVALLAYMAGSAATPVFLIPILISFYYARRPRHIFLYSFPCALIPTLVFVALYGAQYAVSRFLLLYIAGVLLLGVPFALRALIRKIKHSDQPTEQLPKRQIKLNPFFCKSEGARRLSIVTSFFVLVCWVLFVATATNHGGPASVLAALVGFPVALYLIILALRGTVLWVSRGFVSSKQE